MFIFEKFYSSSLKNIIENINDNEEKELVMALLSSYSKELITNEIILDEVPTTHTSTSIRFIPRTLDFTEQ